MKTCLGMSILNESPFLSLHLPYMLESGVFDGVVVVDGGSTDETLSTLDGIMRAFPHVDYHLVKRPWAWDFAAQQNAAIEAAEKNGFTHFFKYDPDELMFHDDLKIAFDMLTKEPVALCVSRVNFEGDRRHYCPYLFSDTQVRFWKLNRGIRWEKRLHAGLNVFKLFGPENRSSDPGAHRLIVNMTGMNIFHYEGIRPMQERALKWLNYARVREGKEPLSTLPRDQWPERGHIPRFSVPYGAPQPLNPDTIGIYAPFEGGPFGDY